MPQGLPRRLAIVSLLFAAVLAHGALNLNGFLHDPIPALSVMTAMWLVGVATYPKERPDGWKARMAPTMVVATSALGLLAACVTCYTAGRYAGRTDFDALTSIGLGLVIGSAVQHLCLLIDLVQASSGPREAAA